MSNRRRHNPLFGCYLCRLLYGLSFWYPESMQDHSQTTGRISARNDSEVCLAVFPRISVTLTVSKVARRHTRLARDY